MWRGDLLEGLDAADWVVTLRDEYRDLRSRATAALADAAEARGDAEPALRWTRERVTLEPLSEEANRELMRRLADMGDRSAALLVYDELAERLRSELRIAPSTVTRALADALRDADGAGANLRTSGPRDQRASRGRARPGFVQALREYVDRVGAASVATLAGVELARLLPELRVGVPARTAD